MDGPSRHSLDCEAVVGVDVGYHRKGGCFRGVLFGTSYGPGEILGPGRDQGGGPQVPFLVEDQLMVGVPEDLQHAPPGL